MGVGGIILWATHRTKNDLPPGYGHPTDSHSHTHLHTLWLFLASFSFHWSDQGWAHSSQTVQQGTLPTVLQRTQRGTKRYFKLPREIQWYPLSVRPHTNYQLEVVSVPATHWTVPHCCQWYPVPKQNVNVEQEIRVAVSNRIPTLKNLYRAQEAHTSISK